MGHVKRKEGGGWGGRKIIKIKGGEINGEIKGEVKEESKERWRRVRERNIFFRSIRKHGRLKETETIKIHQSSLQHQS